MVWKAGKHERANKWAKIYVERPLTLHIFFYAYQLCMNYIIAILLSATFLSTSNHFLYFASFRAGSVPIPK